MKQVAGPLVFDAHAHAFPDQLASEAVRRLTASARACPIRPSHDGTTKGLLECMDRAGISHALLLSVATKAGQVFRITDWAAEAASERLIPFASIHPDYAEPEHEALRIAKLGLRGIKFHPQYMNCAADDPRAIRIARAAEAAGLAMIFHAGYDVAFPDDERASPERLLRLHQAVPGLRVLFAHLGGWRVWDQVLQHLAGRPVYLETSWTKGFCAPELMQAILARHDPAKLLFGSDAPWGDPVEGLAHFMELPLSEEARRRALWDNALCFAGVSLPSK